MLKIQLANRFPCLLLLVSLVVIITGCGDGRPARVKISGHVTIEGKPLKFGGVTFKPAEGGRIAFGGFDGDGQYSTTMYEANDGLPLGSYTVAINATQPINHKSQRWHAPKRYSDHKTAGITVEITEATANLDFDLKWEGDKHSSPWVEKY